MNARQPIENTKISQPTASRTLATLGDEAVRIGAGFAIQYALRDASQVYAAAHAAGLCLPANPEYWNDDEFLQALQVLGHKIVSDRLIGETAKRIARVG